MSRLDREARGHSADPKARFILYNHCNGIQKIHLDKSAVRSPTDFDLASFMTHFSPYQAELSVVQNLYCSPGAYLHGNASSALSCTQRGGNTGSFNGAAGISTMVVGGPTIDQLIATHLGQEERLRSLVLGHPLAITDGNCTQGTIIGRDKDQPVYPTLDPILAHQLVFGVAGQNQILIAQNKSYLDFLKDDIKGFQAELPASERQKLEQYLESVREVEQALSGGLGSCPDMESQPFDEVKPGTTHNSPAFWRYMCDLAVAALQCGATRQVSMLHSSGCVHLQYTFDGATRNHHEDVCHTDEGGEFMEKILGFHAEHFAYMYQKLKAIPEGGGTMADSLLMAWMSDSGGAHHGGTRSHTMVMLGKGNGAIRPGQWFRYPEEKHPLGRAHITLARATGLKLSSFGDGSDPCNGPLPELMT